MSSSSSKRLRERGDRSLKTAAWVVGLFFAVSALVPVLWMLSSSLKDNKSIDAYPPKWIPSLPHAITVTLDYSGVAQGNPEFYEKDAMKATWFPWMKSMNENIGEVVVRGVKDGKLLYEAKTNSASFQTGQPLIVPSTLFNEKMIELKLPIIRERGLSSFDWYGEKGASAESGGVVDAGKPLTSRFLEFYSSSPLVAGKPAEIQESKSFWRLFDSYLTLNKISQETDEKLGFFRYFLNSGIVTAASIALQLVFGGLAGYALSCLVKSKRLKFLLVMFFLATIMIPDVSILIPLYLTMQKLHLVDTLLAIILPHAAWGIVIFLFKGFFDQLPQEVMQAAWADGASDIRTFTSIVVPMSVPIFTIVAIMTFVPVWNEFLWPLVVSKSPGNWTFTVALNSLQQQTSVRENTLMASSVVSMLPLLLVFATSLKYIEKGISFTGVKG